MFEISHGHLPRNLNEELLPRRSPFHFASLDAARQAAAILATGRHDAVLISENGTTVWCNDLAAAWLEARKTSPGSLQWAEQRRSDMAALLRSAAFSFGDWRFEFTLEERPAAGAAYELELYVNATNGRDEERSSWTGVVSRSGAVQRTRFARQMPKACAAWRELRHKPAPYYQELVHHVHEQGLSLEGRLRQYSREPVVWRTPRHGREWEAVADELLRHLVKVPYSFYSSDLDEWQKVLATLEAGHRCCCGFSALEAVLPSVQKPVREQPPLDLDELRSFFTGDYCCATAIAIDRARHHVDECLAAVEHNQGYYQILVKKGRSLDLVDVPRDALDDLLPLVANRNWFALMVNFPAAPDRPVLVEGKFSDRKLLAQARICATLHESSRFSVGGVAHAFLSPGMMYVTTHEGLGFCEPTYRVEDNRGRELGAGVPAWLTVSYANGRYLFDAHLSKTVSHATMEALRTGLLRAFDNHRHNMLACRDTHKEN